jgi:outer membrane receptor protein involved in Fe transport
VDAEGFEAGGYFLLPPEQRGAIDEPATSEALSLYAKGLGALRSNLSLGLRANAFREERGNGTGLTGNETDGALGAVELSGVADLGGRSGALSWQASLSGHTQDFENLFSSQAADRQSETPALNQFAVPSEALAAAFHLVAAVGEATTWTAGVEGRRLEGETNEEFFFTGTFNRRRRAGGEQGFVGLYTQGEWAGERWRVTLGGRVDRWRSRDGRRTVLNLNTGEFLEETLFADRDETEFSPRLSAVFRAADGTYLRAAAYRAFRAPTVNELFRPFRVRNDITAANALLEPETLTGFEVGVDHQWGSADRRRARLTLFRSEGDDMVFNRTLGSGPGVVGPCGFVPPGGLCRQRDNLPSSRVEGADGSLTVTLADGWWATLRYLWSDSEGLEGSPLPQVAEHQGSLQVQYRSSRRPWPSLLLLVRGADRQFEDDQGAIPLAGFVAVDLGLRFPLSGGGAAQGQGGEIFLRGENLFDETIEAARTAEGLLTRGTPRTFHGGVRWRW